MVRRLGVSHKSLLVPNVSAGTYSIRYEHADYIDRNFNITVGSGLPTTFSEAMVEKLYEMTGYPHYGANILEEDHVIIGDIAKAGFTIQNTGNVPAQAHYQLWVVGTDFMGTGDTAVLAIGEATAPIGVDINTSLFSEGQHDVIVNFSAKDHDVTSNLTQTLFVTEWSTDVTFIATAPGIADLHGVEVFIDDISMGTT